MQKERRVHRLGRDICYLRKMAGLTQKALARELGVSASAISKYETHRVIPTQEMLYEMARVLAKHRPDCVKQYYKVMENLFFRAIVEEVMKSPLFRKAEKAKRNENCVENDEIVWSCVKKVEQTSPKKEPLEIELGRGEFGIGAMRWKGKESVVIHKLKIPRTVGESTLDETCWRKTENGRYELPAEYIDAVISMTSPQSAQVLIDKIEVIKRRLIQKQAIESVEIKDRDVIVLIRFARMVKSGTSYGILKQKVKEMKQYGWFISIPMSCSNQIMQGDFFRELAEAIADKDYDSILYYKKHLQDWGWTINYSPQEG